MPRCSFRIAGVHAVRSFSNGAARLLKSSTISMITKEAVKVELMELDNDKLDAAALAILSLTLHDGRRVWKGIDWTVTARLHEKGLIENPAGRAKSLVLTDEGLAKAETALAEMFGKS